MGGVFEGYVNDWRDPRHGWMPEKAPERFSSARSDINCAYIALRRGLEEAINNCFPGLNMVSRL